MERHILVSMATMYSDGATLTTVAEAFGYSVSGTYSALRAHGVQIRPCGAHIARAVDADGEQEIVRLYREGASIKAVAQCMGIGRKAVVNALGRQGETCRTPMEASRARQANEDSLGPRVTSRWINGDGYVVVRVSRNHPHIGMASKHGRILEHRLLMATSLGRNLRRTETVHHINGKRADNRPDNLQLRHGKHGNGQGYVCADCGSHNVVASELAVT